MKERKGGKVNIKPNRNYKPRSKKVIIVLTLVLIVAPVVTHILLYFSDRHRILSTFEGNDVEILAFSRPFQADPSIRPVKVTATCGDIFEPDLGHQMREYDIIVISCVLNPIRRVEDHLVWTSNLLVRDTLSHAIQTQDEKLLNAAMKKLVAEMIQTNREFLKFLLEKDYQEVISNEEYLRQMAHIYLHDVPRESKLFRDKGIKKFVVIPLFDTTSDKEHSTREVKQKLAANIRIAIDRLFRQISREDNREMACVAIPALAGTWGRLDSKYFLSYENSYSAILQGIRQSEIGRNLEQIYVVAWIKLEKEERFQSLIQLAGVYHWYRCKNRYLPLFSWIALLVFPLYGAIYIYYRRISLKGHKARIWILATSLALIFLAWLQVVQNLLAIIMHVSILLLVIVEIAVPIIAVITSHFAFSEEIRKRRQEPTGTAIIS